MFRGWYDHTVDTKGRAAIPASFRDVLGSLGEDRVIVTASISARNLVAYPNSKWQAFEERVRQLPQFDANVERFRRLYIGGAMECTLDKQGRILLPGNLREAAAIQKEIVFVGDIEKFQIWSRVEWQAVQEQDRTHLEDVRATLSDLGL